MTETPDTTIGTATIALGEPIVVHDEYRQCDRCGHEYRTVTDGYRAFADAESASTSDIDLFSRSTARPGVITAACTVIRRGDIECDGEVSIDLTNSEWEPADPNLLALLAHGERIEF